jgi:hypothetical protein
LRSIGGQGWLNSAMFRGEAADRRLDRAAAKWICGQAAGIEG